MASLPDSAEHHKSIISFPGWSKPEEGSTAVWFDVPLAIDGAIEPGLFLHGTDSYEKLIGFTAKAFNINNVDIVPKPPWVYDLLHEQVHWDD